MCCPLAVACHTCMAWAHATVHVAAHAAERCLHARMECSHGPHAALEAGAACTAIDAVVGGEAAVGAAHANGDCTHARPQAAGHTGRKCWVG